MKLNPFSRKASIAPTAYVPVPEEKAIVVSDSVQAAIQSGTANFAAQLGTPLGSLGRNQINEAYLLYENAEYGYLYQRIPAVRTAIDFIARQITQLELELYGTNDEGQREDVDDHPAAALIQSPNPGMPGKYFIYRLVADYLIYGNAYALKIRSGSTFSLYPIPAWKVSPSGESIFQNDRYKIMGEGGAYKYFEPEDVVHIMDYNPSDLRRGFSRLETLRKMLQEEQVMSQTNLEVMKAGLTGIGNAYISRPMDAPEWEDEDRERFQAFLAAAMKDSDEVFPVIEDGMAVMQPNLSPQKAQMLESREFINSTVAKLYGVPLGLLDGSVGDIEAQTANLYQDVLPPICDIFQGFLNIQILGEEYPLEDLCYEFDLKSKLRGDNTARMAANVSAGGGPFLTRNEIREDEGKEPIENPEYDELITPLNVAVGGKPSPMVMPVQDPNGPAQDGSHRDPLPTEPSQDSPSAEKSLPVESKTTELEARAQMLARRKGQERRRDEYATEFQGMLSRHFSRQAASMMSKADGEALADSERWNSELASDILAMSRRQVKHEGDVAAMRLGLGTFDMAQVKHYLETKAANVAKNVNEATQAALHASDTASEVFDQAKSDRAVSLGMTLSSQLSAFSHTEAAKQDTNVSQRMKTWIVTSGNSRHPELNGETVPLYGEFSNGAQLPGDGDASEAAGCQCLVEVG
jgi:HK97 family phage portal protein